jgi:hypothetical protein
MTTEQRLERLERENRWMRRIGVVAVAVVAAVFLIGQGKEKPGVRTQVVEATGVVIRDAKNRNRIEIGVFKEEPAIRMFGPAGKKRLSMDLDADGTPNLFLFDTEGTARGEFVMDFKGTCAFELVDKAGQARADLTSSTRRGKPEPISRCTRTARPCSDCSTPRAT